MFKLKTFFDERNQQIGVGSNPNLRHYRILVLAQKSLDSEMPLGPLEEQFHMPALPVQLRDQFECQGEVVGLGRNVFGHLVVGHDSTPRQNLVSST
jgi:hypothetical protein